MRTGYALRPVSLYNTVHTDSFTATIIIITIADLQKDYVNTSITNQIGRKYFLPQNLFNMNKCKECQTPRGKV